MAQNITLLGANYPDVPAVTLPITGGGTATFSDTRSVTYNLTGGATASVTPSEAVTGQGFSVKLKAPSGYNLSNVTVTMGGVDITSQVFTPDEQGGGGDGSTYIRTEVLPQQTFTGDSSQRRATLTGMTEGFADGEYYIVTYDNVEWLTTCETLWSTNFCIGEAQWFLGTPDAVYPFGVIWENGTTATVAAANTSQHTIKIEHLEFVEDGVNLGTKTITQNGTYNASSDSLDGFSSVTVNVSGGSPSLQTKSVSYTPTTSAQSAQVTADSGYDGLQQVNVSVGAIPSQYIVPSGTKSITENGTGIDVTQYASVDVAVPASGVEVKTKTGTFTGNGTRQVTISCDFEPDLIYWTSDPGTSASSGTVAGIIAREMMSANRYRNNSTSNSHYAVIDITAMNTSGSSYSFRATYENSTVTLYCFSSNARSLFTNGRTYTYKFVKWTT